jgi:outer membrane protein assembly factor BamE (lipoprotein component of BamABCDE complex)
MRNIGLSLFLVLVTGCTVSSGVKVDQSQLSDFKKGATTESQVLARLGQPSTNTHGTGGDLLNYVFTTSTASGANFVPVLNWFKGHTDSTTTMCQFAFDAHQVLTNYSCTDANASQHAALGH